MTATEFEESLLALLHRKPFVPFEVELHDGERFTVDRPDAVSFGGTSAGFLSEEYSLHDFDWKTTRRMGAPVSEAPA
jgi:hypothetical protein